MQRAGAHNGQKKGGGYLEECMNIKGKGERAWDTCLNVVFSRNVQKSTISIFKADFFSGESQEDHAV